VKVIFEADTSAELKKQMDEFFPPKKVTFKFTRDGKEIVDGELKDKPQDRNFVAQKMHDYSETTREVQEKDGVRRKRESNGKAVNLKSSKGAAIGISKSGLQQWLQNVTANKGVPAARNLLKKYNVNKLSELSPTKWEPFIDECKTISGVKK